MMLWGYKHNYIKYKNNLKTPLEWESQEKSGRGQSHIGRKTRFYGKGKVRFGDRDKLGWR